MAQARVYLVAEDEIREVKVLNATTVQHEKLISADEAGATTYGFVCRDAHGEVLAQFIESYVMGWVVENGA